MGNIDNKKRVCKLQGKQKYMILIAFVFVVVSLSLILFWALTRNPIQGEWSVDGVTTYAFYKNGKGCPLQNIHFRIPLRKMFFTSTLHMKVQKMRSIPSALKVIP